MSTSEHGRRMHVRRLEDLGRRRNVLEYTARGACTERERDGFLPRAERAGNTLQLVSPPAGTRMSEVRTPGRRRGVWTMHA